MVVATPTRTMTLRLVEENKNSGRKRHRNVTFHALGMHVRRPIDKVICFMCDVFYWDDADKMGREGGIRIDLQNSPKAF